LTGLSDEVLALLPLAEPARRNKKLPVQQLRDIIQRLCVSRWLSASEIAGLVVRDAEKLQARLLTAMVNAGLLELRHPTVRNRPDQAYRTVSAAVPSK
jgi:ATP-dependent DNA helicase RecG